MTSNFGLSKVLRGGVWIHRLLPRPAGRGGAPAFQHRQCLRALATGALLMVQLKLMWPMDEMTDQPGFWKVKYELRLIS